MIGYGTNIVRNGLVLHLDAANPKSYPGSGTTWYDLSGNGNHGTLVNGPTYSSNNKGSIVFDGVNDYAQSPVISTNTGFTIAIWLYGIKWYLESCPCPNTGGILDWGTGYWNWTSIMSSPSGPYFALYADDSINRKSASFNASSQLNQWLNLKATYDNNTKNFKIYKNGNLISSDNISASFSLSAPVYYASYSRHCGYCYTNILLSSVQIYNRALSSAEIAQNFEATRGRYSI